jgi:hypothetical protein
MGKFGIFGPQFTFRHAVGQIVEYERNPEARAPDSRPAAAYLGVDRNALQQRVHGCKLSGKDAASRLRIP